MSQDLASLVIGLRADVATLQSDLGKANALNARYAKEASDSWSNAADQINSRFNDAFKDVAGKVAAALAVDKLLDAARTAIDTADQYNKMSQKVGLSVESLSALNTQAKLSDVSLESLQGGLARLTRNAADAAGGNKQAAATFQAMGVAVKDTNGSLRSTEDILSDVSKRFASYQDGAAKTALAQQTLGKSGAELIPLLNQLGEQGFKKATAEAQKYNQVISGETASQAEEFNDNLTRLSMGASGFANAVVKDLLPSLVDLTNDLSLAAQTSDGYESSASKVADVILELITDGRDLAKVVSGFPDDVRDTATAFDEWTSKLAGTNDQLAKLLDKLPKVKSQNGGGLFQFPTGAGGLLPGVQSARDFLDFITTPTLGSDLADKTMQAKLAPQIAAATDLKAALRATIPDIDAASQSVTGLSLHIDDSAVSAAKAKAPIVSLGTSSADSMQRAEDQAAKFLAQVQGFGADKYTKALADYNAKLQDVNAIFDKMIASNVDYAKAERFANDATQALNDGFDAQVQAMRNANDASAILSTSYAKAADDINNQIRLLGMDEQARKEDELATRLITAALGDMKDFVGPLSEDQQKLIDKLTALAHGFVTTSDAIEKNKQAMQELAGIAKSAGDSIADSFSKWVVEGGSLIKSLGDVAKQTVEQIIAYFSRLAIINPILNSLFAGSLGGSGGVLPTLGSLAGVVAGGASVGAGDFNMGGYSGTATAASNSAMFGTANGSVSILSAGKTLWDGFSTGFSKFWNGAGYNMGGPAGLSGTGYTSGFGQALGIAGGVYAGYNRYQQGGALGGVAGGLAYGAGTYALGAGIAGAAAGTGFAAGVGGAFAIPVIGWAALIALVVDKISGGKLFGTDANKFQFGQQTIDVSATGASVSAGYDMKGQKALFGGSFHEWTTVDPSQEAVDAANQFFEQIKKGSEQFAKQFGVTVGDIVGGTFTQTFDKKGNVTATSDTVLGKTYNEDQDKFAERLQAENMIAVLSKFDSALSDTVDQYRADADQLAAVASALASAETAMQGGEKFLALGTDQSLSALLALAQGSEAFGESIDQTLQRIIQSQAQYDQFVSQFKPATNYVDDFEGTLSQINQSMLANVKQANALAVAAGAAGASEKDLANIHAYAAKQAADAIKALKASAQSLAFSLGLTTQGSLDQVNQEIAELQAKAGNSSQAVQGFGDAMAEAAEKAKAAMDLLLGDLSPLNDQQKLQQALSAQMRGLVTPDAVLQIARRLYGSTEQYNAIFAQVQGIGDRTGAQATGSHAQSRLNASESKRLADLLAQQQTLQQAAQLQQYQQLGQQVAEISEATGEDWRDVLKDMGVNVDDFEKGLKLNDQQTADYIDKIQKQTDSMGENTSSLIKALQDLTRALGGTVTSDDGTTAPFGQNSDFGNGSATGSNDPRRRGHSQRMSPEEARQVGQGIAIGMQTGGARTVRPLPSGATARV